MLSWLLNRIQHLQNYLFIRVKKAVSAQKFQNKIPASSFLAFQKALVSATHPHSKYHLDILPPSSTAFYLRRCLTFYYFTE